MRAAFKLGISTLNGYSGNTPAGYEAIFLNDRLDSKQKILAWTILHPDLEKSRICIVDSQNKL